MFQYIGDEALLGNNASVWQMISIQGQKKNTYTMWVDLTGPQTKPLQYEMMGYDTLLGSHYDKYVLTYNIYEPGPISNDIFNVPKGI